MSRLWWVPSVLVACGMVLGPLAAFTELVDPWTAFRVFFAGSAIAVVSAVALGGAAAVGSLRSAPWRPQALRAAVIPVLATAVLLVVQISSGGPDALFNDVTTDLDDPPVFTTGPAAGEGYPEEFAGWQRDSYPDLAPLRVAAPPDEVFARALKTARSMPRWEIVQQDPQAGIIEAVAVTRLFRFRDDVVIRVRPDGTGSRLDVRSRSRVGRGDLGTNHARIRAFLAALEAS